MFKEYPKALYEGGKGAQFEQLPYVVVSSREEEDAKNAEGWYEIGTAPAEDKPSDDLAALRVDAEAKGLRVDKRWGADRLREELAKVA